MKKFQFAAGLLTLAMLGACSSDAPDAPNTVPGDGEEGATEYVALRIAMEGMTRADSNSKDGDSEIKGISMYIIDPTDNSTIRRMTTTDISGGMAYFKVTNLSYETLDDYLDKKVTLKVYANLGVNGITLPEAYEYQDDTEAQTWKANQFLMSGEGLNLKLSREKFDDGDNSQKATAWVLNGGGEDCQTTINLTRLATRFDLEDYTDITDMTYTATSDNRLTLKVVGLSVNTHETKTFWFKQKTEWLTPNCEENDPEKNKKLNEHDYTFLSSSKKTNYARPHIVDNTIEDKTITYGAASYVAIKAEFTHSILADENNKDATTVYGMNGHLLGSYKYITSLKKTTDAATKTAVEGAYKDDAVRASIITLLGDMNNFTEETLSGNPGQYTQYKKADDGKWYTYYNAMLKNDDGETITATNADLVRNTIYQISIKSFAGLCFGGEEKPQKPKDDTKLLYVNLGINVVDWDVNSSNTALEF